MPAITTSTEHQRTGYNRRTFAHEQFNLVSPASGGKPAPGEEPGRTQLLQETCIRPRVRAQRAVGQVGLEVKGEVAEVDNLEFHPEGVVGF
jgi:hypothetical protein